MTAGERTPLLAHPEGENAEEWEESTAGSTKDRKVFALWQLGAFFGILLAYSDTSLVWATHETVSSHFNNLQNSSWIMTTFAIGYCVTLPVYARLSDNYGRLIPLLSSYFIFCLGCTICGVCQAYWQLLMGRALTGCGASGVISLASIIVTDIADPSDVAVLRSYLNVASTVGLSIGGPLGGLISGTIGWRWCFLGQLPIAICCCFLITQGLRQTSRKSHDEDDDLLENPKRQIILSFDFPGASVLAIAVTLLLSVIDMQSKYSWTDPLVQALLVGTALSIATFLYLETWPGDRELLIPSRLLRTEIGAFCAGQILIAGSSHGFVSQIASYFSNTQGASDLQGGLQAIPCSIGNAVGSIIAGQLIKRSISYKKITLASLTLSITILLVMLFQWSSHAINTWETLTTLPYGVFGGTMLSAQFIGLYMCAPKHEMTTAIGMYYMSQQIGIALGISVCSSVLKGQFRYRLHEKMANIPGHKAIIKAILRDSSILKMLPTELKQLVSKSYLDSFWVVPALVIGAQLLTFLPMAFTTVRRSK